MTTIENALSEGALYIAYQPIVDLEARSTFGFEALVRSHSRALPDPPRILRAAIESGYMGRLGRLLRSMAIQGCPDYPLFLNIHPDEFDEGWLIRPDDAANQHDRGIYLEITETVPLSHYRFCHSVLAELRRRGVMIAVDDLGAGYSNLKYIADLEPEIVKLDRGLIAGIDRSRRLQKLCTSLVELCRNLGARVVAEGIETADELRAVLDTGAHYGQGFFLARPSPEVNTVNLDTLLQAPLQAGSSGSRLGRR